MDRDLFCRVGAALYGPPPLWHEPLSIDLAVGLRTCQRWAAGTREIPDIEMELLALIHERGRELATVADLLSDEPVDP